MPVYLEQVKFVVWLYTITRVNGKKRFIYLCGAVLKSARKDFSERTADQEILYSTVISPA